MRAQRRYFALQIATLVLLLIAVACYALGFDQGGLLLLFLAAMLGLWSWLRAVQAPRHSSLSAQIDTRMSRH